MWTTCPVWTGMRTVPASVTLPSTEMVRVGAVGSASEVTLTPDGAVISERDTVAATASPARVATTCVVTLPGRAAVDEPEKV